MMTTEAFWHQLGSFNATTWPVQAIWLCITLFVTYLIFTKPSPGASLSMKILLTFAFAWNGIAFFLVTCDGAVHTFFFAPLFLVVALLFAIDIFTQQTQFKWPDVGWKRYATLLWLLAWLGYPLVGMALGRNFPELCLPMNPCPLTVFAIAWMAAAIPQIDLKAYLMLLPWGLLGLPKCLGAYQCYEDCLLFAAGVYGAVMISIHWKKKRKIYKTQKGDSHDK